MRIKRFTSGHWEGTFVGILCVFLLVAGVACGKKDPAAFPPAGPETPNIAAGTSREPARDSGLASSGGKLSATIVPPTPSRSIPPRIEVTSSTGEPVPILQVRWKVGGEIVAEGDRLAPGMFRTGDTISAEVTVKSAERTISLETPVVVAKRSLPSIREVHLEPAPIRAGDIVRAVVMAENPDESPLTFRYRWYVDDVPVPGDGPELVANDVRKGAWVHVMVVPNDGISDGSWKYSPKHKVVNSPPVVKDDPPTVIQPGGLFLHTIKAEDPDGDTVAYALEKAPAGMILTGSTLRWQLPDDAYGKSVQVVVRISDDDGGVTATTFTMTPRKD
jgi:predicted small lipoprotein YifL